MNTFTSFEEWLEASGLSTAKPRAIEILRNCWNAGSLATLELMLQNLEGQGADTEPIRWLIEARMKGEVQ